jgi:hypothetical protein
MLIIFMYLCAWFWKQKTNYHECIKIVKLIH